MSGVYKQMKRHEQNRKKDEDKRVPTLSILRWSKRRKTKLARRKEQAWRMLRKGLDHYTG